MVETEARARAIAAIFADIRDRKLLKYLFAQEPETRGGYGFVEAPIDTETQNEMVSAWVDLALTHPEPRPELREAIARIISDAAADAAMVWEGTGSGLSDIDIFSEAADAILALPEQGLRSMDSAPREALIEVNRLLVADLGGFEGDFSCEACSAPLFDGDDFVSDPDGCHGCWASMTDVASDRERPCYAYRVGKPSAVLPSPEPAGEGK